MAWAVYGRGVSDRPVAAGLQALLEFSMPGLALGIVVGAWAERHDRVDDFVGDPVGQQ